MFTYGRLFRAAAAAVAVGTAAGTAGAQQRLSTTAGPDCLTAPAYQFTPPCPIPGTLSPGTVGTESAPLADASPSFATRTAGAGVGESTSVSLGGYIDNAAPTTMFRLRYDNGYGMNRPDRAEFFYAKCGCFRGANPPQLDAHGPPLPETNIDYQEILPYFEYAFSPRFSLFGTIPVRLINPAANRNASGLGDIDFGFKYAFVQGPTRTLSLQVRAIAPSGNEGAGLGTGNWWLEPGLLYLEQFNTRWQGFGELRYQIPLSKQSDFTGSVLRYGVGTAYQVVQQDWGYAAPVGELVGWTALSGRELADSGAVDATGATIVNAKVGVRVGFGKKDCNSSQTPNDIYVGYGRALTGEFWYKDMLRIEYRRFF